MLSYEGKLMQAARRPVERHQLDKWLMGLRLFSVLFIVAVFLGCSSSPKASKSSVPKAGPIQKVLVTADESLIYSKPDFDSKVKGSLPKGAVLNVHKKSFRKSKTEPAFRKVVKANGLKSGRRQFKVLGWIAAHEVEPWSLAQEKSLKEQSTQPVARGPFAEESEGPGDTPLPFKEGVGLGAQLAFWKEHFLGEVRQERVFAASVKKIGPPFEWSMQLAYGAPQFLTSTGAINSAGYQVWAEALLAPPLRLRSSTVLGVLVGPAVGFTHLATDLPGGSRYELNAVRFGFNTGGYGTLCLSSSRAGCQSALRGEAVWFFERHSYPLVRLFWVSFLD